MFIVTSLEASYARESCGNAKSCNCTSCSVARPRQSLGRVARHAEKLQLYLAFGRWTTPIHGKGCAGRRKVGKSCNFTSRSRVRPRRKNVQLYLAFARSTTPIHGKGCAWRRQVATLPRVRALDHANPWERLRVALTSCNFTSRSRARPRQSMVRVAFPINGVGAGSSFRKNI